MARLNDLLVLGDSNLLGALNSYGEVTAPKFNGLASNADMVDSYHASSLFKIYAWNNHSSSYNIDDLINGTTFAYTTHNSPVTGTIVDFSNSTSTTYRLQLAGSYSSQDLKFRSRNGDNQTWLDWSTILHNNNYTSYTVQKDGTGATGTWPITSNRAKLLELSHGSVGSGTTTETSTWSGSLNDITYVWGQRWVNSNLSSDSGDLVLGIRKGVYSTTGTELCMMIDGDYYSMGNKVLHAGNYTDYAPTKTGGGASGTWGINISGNAATASQFSTSIVFTPGNTAITPEAVRDAIGAGGRIKRATWAYAANAHINASVGTIDLAGATIIQANNSTSSSNALTQLYITATTSDVAGALKGDLLYYINNGPSYSPAWHRVAIATKANTFTDSNTFIPGIKIGDNKVSLQYVASTESLDFIFT